jgi:hypothetical protein
MSKRVLAILVAALLAVGIFSAVANAGVEGSFKFDIWMWPQTTAFEATGFNIDFEALLKLNITFSGLTIGNDIAMGIAGMEHYILTLTTTLGALDLSDTFAFAAPYIGCPRRAPAKYWYIDFFYASGPFTTCRPVGDMMFVKKRVSMELSIGGLSFSALIMFEDVNFPSPTAKTLGAVDKDGDGVYEPTEQDFNFGAIVGISGTTVSGIEIEAKSGFCADWTIFTPSIDLPKWLGTSPYGGFWEYVTNDIKKYRWYETVCATGELGLTKEFIGIYNIGLIPNLVLNSYTIMTLAPAFDTYLEAVYTLPMNLGVLQTFFHITGGLALGGPEFATLLLSMENLKAVWFDYDSDWTLTANDVVALSIGFDLQAASFLVDALFIPTIGVDKFLVEVDLPISYPEPIGTLEITGLWSAGTKTILECTCDPETKEPVCEEVKVSDGKPVFDAVDFNLKKSFGEHNTFKIDAQFGAKGLRAIEFAVGVTFSL